MKPSDKSDEVESKIESIFGFNRRAYIQDNRCVPPPVGCGGPAVKFRDELSRKEFSISGLCQKCQDSVWPEEEDDET
jgi:hypothetical protein